MFQFPDYIALTDGAIFKDRSIALLDEMKGSWLKGLRFTFSHSSDQVYTLVKDVDPIIDGRGWITFEPNAVDVIPDNAMVLLA